MAVTYQTPGASASGIDSATPAYPANVAANDLLLLLVGSKPYTATPTTAAFGYPIATIADGTTAGGAGTGSTVATVFARYPDGALTGTETVSVTSGSPTMAKILRFTKDTGNGWSVVAQAFADTTATGTAVSATSATTPSVTAGDTLVVHAVTPDDATTHTSQSLAVPGCTLSAVTWLTTVTTSSGNDGAMHIGYATVSSGTATGNATYTATSSVSGKSATAVTLTRVREITIPATATLVDDFNAGTVDTTVWNDTVGAVTVVSGNAIIPIPYFQSAWNPRLGAKPFTAVDSSITMYIGAQPPNLSREVGVKLEPVATAGTESNMVSMFATSGATQLYLRVRNAGVQDQVVSSWSWTDNPWWRLRHTSSGTPTWHVDVSANGSTWTSDVLTRPATGWTPSNVAVQFGGLWWSGTDGDATFTLGSVNVSQNISGTLSASTPKLVGTLAGAAVNAGTMNGSAPLVTGAVTGGSTPGTIGWGNVAAFPNAWAGDGNITPEWPTIVAGHLIVIVHTVKSASNTFPTTPSGYTVLASGTGGTGSFANDTGPCGAIMWAKVAAGGETAPTFGAVTDGGANYSGMFWSFTLTKDAALSWVLGPGTSGQDTTSGTDFSATGGSDLGLASGDWLLNVAVHPSDAVTSASARGNTCAGVTFAGAVARVFQSTAQGRDSAMGVWTNAVSSGTSSAAPVATSTLNTATTGVAVMARVRTEVASNPGTLSASLPVATATATGAAKNAGALSVAALLLAGTLTGASLNTGTLNTASPAVTGTVAGASLNPGTLTTTTPDATCAVTGVATNPGTLTTAVPKVTGSIGAQASTNPGALTVPVPLATWVATGASTATGSLAGSVPTLRAAVGSQTTTNPGTLTATTLPVTGELTGTSTSPGTLTAVAPLVAGALTGAVVNPGTLTVTAPVATGAVTGASANPGTLNANTRSVLATIGDQTLVSGTLTAAVPKVTGAVTGSSTLTGATAATLPLPVGSLPGTSRNPGSLTGATPALTGTVAGAASWTATLNASLPVLAGVLPAGSTNPAALTGALPVLTGTVDGAASNSGALTASTLALSGELTGTSHNPGATAGALPLVGILFGWAPDPDSVTPPERTLTIPAESRTLVIPAESRTLEVTR